MTDTRTIINISDGSEEDRMFEGAFNSILHTDKKDYPAYIGGLKVASGSDFPVTSPIDSSIKFGMFQEPESGISDKAVDAALKAFKGWSGTDPTVRADIFEKFVNALKKQRYRVAAMVTLSSGMTRDRSLFETDRLIEVIEKGIADIRATKGKAVGVWAIISEHNSPLAAPFGYAAIAILTGNTVVMMPSRYAPIPIYMMYDLLAPSIPDGVLNVITDRRGKETEHLTENEDLSGIVAIGSGQRIEEMMFMKTDDKTRFINESKGMNPVIVNRPHNMTQTVYSILENAFSYCGQEISSTSKVIILADEQKEFMNALTKAYSDLLIGDPADRETTTGPLISKEAFDAFSDITHLKKDHLVNGGERVSNYITEAGFYVKPTVFAGLRSEDNLNNIDHGLPILSVQIAEDMDEAIEMMNGCDIGKFSGLYSKDDKTILKFRSEAISDIVYVNDPDSVPRCALKCDIKEFMK